MNALVTGGRGYLGQPLSAALLAQGAQVTRLGRSEPLGVGAARDLVGDVRDPATIAAAVASSTHIFHLAAQTSVAVAETAPASDLKKN